MSGKSTGSVSCSRGTATDRTHVELQVQLGLPPGSPGSEKSSVEKDASSKNRRHTENNGTKNLLTSAQNSNCLETQPDGALNGARVEEGKTTGVNIRPGTTVVLRHPATVIVNSKGRQGRVTDTELSVSQLSTTHLLISANLRNLQL